MKLPLINTTAAVGGEWSFKVLDGNRNVLREYEPFHNLVTNIGLDRMGADSALFSHCRIGTGTAAAAVTDTALQSQSASTNNPISTSSSNAGAPNYQTTTTVVFEFALGAVVGNMAEIGCGWSASSANTLYSRARINDAGGSPTTITVLVTEILQATYRFTIYPKTTDDTGSVNIGGTSYNYTSRRHTIGNSMAFGLSHNWINSLSPTTVFTGTISANTGTGPGGSSATMGSVAAIGYTNGTYYRDFTISSSISQANVAGGIKSISFTAGNSAALVSPHQMEFNNVIPKDNTKTMSLIIRSSWARYP